MLNTAKTAGIYRGVSAGTPIIVNAEGFFGGEAFPESSLGGQDALYEARTTRALSHGDAARIVNVRGTALMVRTESAEPPAWKTSRRTCGGAAAGMAIMLGAALGHGAPAEAGAVVASAEFLEPWSPQGFYGWGTVAGTAPMASGVSVPLQLSGDIGVPASWGATRDKLKQKVRHFATQPLDWYDGDAELVSEDTVSLANEIIDKITYPMELPHVSHSPDGEIAMNWVRGGLRFEAVVDREQDLVWVVDTGQGIESGIDGNAMSSDRAQFWERLQQFMNG